MARFCAKCELVLLTVIQQSNENWKTNTVCASNQITKITEFKDKRVSFQRAELSKQERNLSTPNIHSSDSQDDPHILTNGKYVTNLTPF